MTDRDRAERRDQDRSSGHRLRSSDERAAASEERRPVLDRVRTDAAERLRALARTGIDRVRSPTLGLGVLAAVLVFVVSVVVFPYHSTNHDEAVYLQQAAMLLEGQVFLRPPVPDAFRPWFFVQDGDALYAKYTPVTATVFALGKALTGSYRIALAVVAAGNVALTVTLGRQLFDRTTGLLAGLFLLASPLFLVTSAVFLSYAPTTLFNLAFAVAYLRAVRVSDESGIAAARWGAVAGLAIGLAFFTRPYTAVLFALPFILHATYGVLTLRSRAWVATAGTTGVVGVAWVAIAFGYNVHVTGDPLTFPYEAFAPRDGLGFGTREILEYSREYTPALALRANAEVVARLLLRWTPLGLAGVILAGWGFWRSGRDRQGVSSESAGSERQAGDAQSIAATASAGRLLVPAVVPAVVLGNVLFWGNLNVLGDLETLADGLVWTLGPYYHFDLLAPVAIFAAFGTRDVATRIRRIRGQATGRRRKIATAVGLVAVVVVTAVGAASIAVPLADNHGNAERLAGAYDVDQDVVDGDGAAPPVVVFLPQIYGSWLNHPFQAYRNDPGFDEDVVYALDRGEGNFPVVDAYPSRAYYRYTYQGTWAPADGETVDARLQRVDVARGDRVGVNVSLGRPDWVVRGAIELTTSQGSVAYYVEDAPTGGDGETIDARLVVAEGSARLVGADVTPQSGNGSVPISATDTVRLVATLDSRSSAGLTYRLSTPVRAGVGDRATAVMTPRIEACVAYTDCQDGAAFLPSDAPPGVDVSVAVWGETLDRSTAAPMLMDPFVNDTQRAVFEREQDRWCSH